MGAFQSKHESFPANDDSVQIIHASVEPREPLFSLVAPGTMPMQEDAFFVSVHGKPLAVRRLLDHPSLYGIACKIPSKGWAIEFDRRERTFYPELGGSPLYWMTFIVPKGETARAQQVAAEVSAALQNLVVERVIASFRVQTVATSLERALSLDKKM